MFNKSVLKREQAESLTIEYRPKKFPFTMSESASDFIKMNPDHGLPGNFRLNPLIAEQTGVAGLEQKSDEDLIEQKVLEKLKEIQEAGYREAHSLGLEEGRLEALKKYEADFSDRLKHFDELLATVNELKLDLVNFNEAHIVKLIYFIASRLAMFEISEHSEAIVSVLKSVISSSAEQDQITVKLSTSDFAFLQSMRSQVRGETKADWPALDNVRLEQSEEIRSGGCVIETNYGMVDATLEERVEKMMEAIFQSTPKVRDVIAS